MTARQFIRVSRPPTLSASVIPLLVGGIAAWINGHFVMWAWIDIVIIAFLMQIAVNMLNEHFDFEGGLDNAESLGIGGIIVSGEVTSHDVKRMAIILYTIALLLGLILTWYRGETILIMGLLGILAGFFYSGGPFPISSTPFGEIMVMGIMGPLEILATEMAASGHITQLGWIVSFPIGLLVASILLANNLRDCDKDGRHGRRTIPVLFGPMGGMAFLAAFIGGALVIITIAVVMHVFPPTSLIVWLALPVIYKSLRSLWNNGLPNAVSIIGRLNLIMGILLSVGLIIGR